MADPQNITTAAELDENTLIKNFSFAPQEDNTDAFFIRNNDPLKTELDELRKQEEMEAPVHLLIQQQKEAEKQFKINNPNYTSADLKKLYADFKTQRDSALAESTSRRNRIKELTQEYNQKRADYEIWGSVGLWKKDQTKKIISKWKETGDPTWLKLQKAKTVPGVDLASVEKAEQNYIGAALREQEYLLFVSAEYDAIKSDLLDKGLIKDENSLALDWKIDPRTMKLTNGNQTVDIGKNTLNYLKKLQIAKDLNGRAGMNERDWLKFFILNPETTAQNPEFFIDPDTKTETRDQDLKKIVDNYFSENLLLEAESAGRLLIRTEYEKAAVAKADALEKVKKGEAVVLQDGRIAKADAPAGKGIIFDPNDYNGYLALLPDGTDVDELVHGDPEKFAETYAAIGLMLANPNEQTFLGKEYDVLKKYWAKNGAGNVFNIARNVNYRNSNDFKRAREFDQEETDAFLNIMKNPQAVDKVTDGIGALAAVSIMKDGGIDGKTNAEIGKRLGFFASFADGFGESFGSLSHFANNVMKGSAITATANAVLDNKFMRINSLRDDLDSRIKTFGPEIVGLNQLSKKYKVEKKKANDKFKLYAKQRGINVTDEDLKNIEVYRSTDGNEIGTAYNNFVKENPYVDQLIDPWMRIAQKAEVAGHPIIDKDSRGNITRQGYADLEKMKKAVEMTADLLNQNAIYKSHLKTNDFGRFLGSATAEVAYMAPEAIGPGIGKLAFSGIAKGVAKSAARNAGKTAVQKFDDALLAAVTPNRGQLYILGNVPGRTATRAGLEKNWQKLNQSEDGVSVDLEKLNDKESVLLSDVLPETLAEYAVGPAAGALGKLIKSGGGKLIAKATKNNAAGKFINRLANNKLVNSARKGIATVKEFVPTQSGALGEWLEERASAIYEATFNFNNSSAGLGERMRDALSFSKNWEQWGAEIAAFSIPGLAGAGGSVLIDAGKRGIGKITNNKSDRQKLIERVKAIDAFVKENSPLDYNNGKFDWAAATAAKALADFREKHPDVNVLEIDKVTGKTINELPNHVNLTEQEVMQAALYEHYTDVYPELKNSVEKSVQNGTPAESAMTDAIRRGMIRDSIAVRTSEDFTEQQKAIVTDAVNQEYLAETIGALQSDKELAGNSYAQEKILEAVQMMPDKESVRLLSPEAVQAQYTAIYNRLQKDFAPQMASNSVTLRNLYVNETGRTAPAQETAPATPVPTTETAVSTPAQAQQIAETNAVNPEPATAIPATKQLNDNILPGTSKTENIDSILAESAAENKSNAEIAEQIINTENAPAAETVTETEQTATEQQTTEIPQETTVSATEQQQDTVKPFEPLASRDNASKAELSRIARMGLSGAYEISVNNITGENAETANAIKTLMESALGVEVVFYHNPDNRLNEGGFHTGGRIFINERILEKSDVAIRTAGHEFLHFLADSNPELYKQLQAVLLEKAKTNKLLKKIYDKIYSVYSDKGLQELNNNYSGSVNMNLINEEFTNRVFEAFFTDQNFAKEILSNIENENPGIIKQLWEAFKKYVNAFIRAAQSNENLRETYKEHLKEDFSKFENLLKSVIKEYQAKNRERIAQWNKQEQIQQEVVGSTAANGVQAVKVSEINVDPERFQFKQDMKKDTGVSTSSQITAKKWNPLYAGLLYLWQDKDGKLFVVNGHHRLDLAKRLGVEEINAQIDREVDGVTAEQAYIKGALINIKNGNGTVYDYANFFRKSKMSRQDALDDGFIAKGKTLAGIRANEQLKRSMTGWLIAQGSEDLWSWYVNQDENAENKITDEMFATIVEKANGVDSIELYAINAINRGAVKNMAELNSVLDGAKSRYDAANQDSGMSDGFLFGDSEADAMIEADKKLGDFARKKSNELQGLISILKKVLNNPKNAKATKIKIDKGDIRSVKQAKKDLQEYEKQKVMFDNPFVNRDFVETEIRKAETGTETAAAAPAPKTEKKKLIKEKTARKTDVNESTPAETDSKPKPKTETKATLPKYKLEHIEHIDKKDVPKDVAWKDRKFKSENYYSSVRVGIVGNDAYFEFRTGLSSLQQKVFYKISDFRDTSIMQVRREIEDYFSGNSEAYPMGKNFDDALDSLHDDGMRVENYSTLKPMTASAPAAKTPKTETQPASAPAMSDEFPLLTEEEDANDFQLSGETLSEKDQQKIEDRKAKEGKKKAEKETLDLPIEENKTPASAPVKSLDDLKGRSKRLKPKAEKDAIERIKVIANNISKNADTGIKLSVMEQEKRPYYEIPWEEGLQKAVTDKSVREPIFVSETPAVFKNIGFTALPMMMNVRHLRLNYYNKTDFEKMFGTMRQGEHTHNLRDNLKKLRKALKNPLAIVVNQTPKATPGSVVAITDMDVNGKKVVVPILIESKKTVNGNDIDSHLVLTVYDSDNWVDDFLKPAIKAEKNGVGIFYFDKEKAKRYPAYSNKIRKIPIGVLHNIADVGIKVKPQIETFQFKKWFRDSKVVDENGEPLVVYHGSSADFTVFDHRFGYRNGAAEGRGFYFTSDKNKAEGYKTENGKLFGVYLSLHKPLNPDELTITKAEVEKIIRAIDTDGTYVSDYAENDNGYPSKTWHDKAVKSAVNAIYDSSDNNADIVAEIYSVFGQGDALAKITEATGYDGFIKDDVYVVFNSTQIKSATDNIGTFDRTNPDIRFSLLDADALKDLSPLERLTEAFEESEPNEIDRNIYIVFRKYMDELIEQGSVKQDSDFARANAVLQNYERDHGIHQASLLYRKMIADKMFGLPVFNESIGTADEALKTAPEVPKDFANAVRTVFTGAKFKPVFTEEERKTVDHGEAIEATQKPEETDKEQSNDENLLHLTNEQMEKDGYTAKQKKEQKEFAERIEELGKKLDNKEISAKQAKDELADIYDKYITPFNNFISRYSANANQDIKLEPHEVINIAYSEITNRIEDYAETPTGNFTRSLVNAINTAVSRKKRKTNKQRGNEAAITDENGKNLTEHAADPNPDVRNETDDAMQSVKEQLLNIEKELRSRLENTKDKTDRLTLLRRSWVARAIADIGGMAYERRNVVDWLNKHIAEIEKDCENHGVVWDRTYGKGTDARYNKDLRAIYPNIQMSILSEEMNENMKKAGVLQMISSALSAAELPTNYQKDISWLERLFIPSAQYFNKTPQIFKFYTALDDMNRYKMDMLANLTGDNGLGENYIVTMQRLEDRKPEKSKSLYRYIIDADRFRIGGEVNVVTGNKRRYWYTYRDGSSSRDFNTAAERDKAMELDPQYKKQKLIARSEPKDISFVATDKDGKTIGSYKSFTEAHIAVIQNEIKTLAGKGITIDGTNHRFDNEQLLALQSFRLMALNGYNQIAKRFAEIRNHIESSGGDFASFLKEQKVFDIYDEFVKMGKAASYYMPRIRKPGRYKITAKRGKETILYFVDSVSKIRLKAEIRKLKKDGWTDVEYEDTGDHTNAEIVGLDLTRLNTIVNQALQQMEKDAFKNGVLDNKMLKDSFGMELTIDSGVTDKKGNKHDNIEIVFDKSHYQAELNLALRDFLKDSVAVVKENDSTITAKWIVPANQGEMLAKTFIKSIMNIHGKQTVLGSFTETLQNVIGSIIKASGYRARSISRNEKIGKEVTQGYVENPLEAMKMFLSAMAEGQSRTRFAHASAAIAGGWDYSYDDFMNENHPGEEKSAMYYIEYCIERDKRAVKPHTQMHKDIMNTTEFVLTNADLADRMIATVNGIASIYFLSSPSSALVNTLALYTHVPAAISKSLDESALKAVANVTGGAKRYIQYALARRNGKEAKGLTDEEKAVFGLMSRLGYDSNSNMANALATLDQNTAFGKAQKIMMASFSITESMSRASAIYAAYQAIVEKMKKQGKKFDWKNEDQLRAVLAAAKKVSDQALVDFSKGGKVGIMKNKTARKVIAPFMLFMSFPLNTISLLLKHDANIAPMLDDLGLETKTDKASLIKRLVKGSTWMILASTLLAGLDTMLPISVLQGWFGGDDDDPEKWRKEIAKQLATVFGLIPEDSTYSKVADRMLNYGAASFMNLDLRGSLSTWTILQKTKFTAEDFAKRLFGAPGSLAASFSRSADEFSNAYRDGIWNPESIIRGTEYALPKLLASPLKAYRESVYGVTTLSGKSILDPDAPDTALTEEEQKLYLTGDEKDWWKSYNFYRRALGFNPADVSQKRAEIYANKQVKQGYANRKKELGERIKNYVQAVKDGKRSFNSAEWKQIEQDAEEMRKEYFDLPEEQRKDISPVTNKWFNKEIESVTKLSTKQKASAGDNKAKRKLLNTQQRKENESQEPIKRSK